MRSTHSVALLTVISLAATLVAGCQLSGSNATDSASGDISAEADLARGGRLYDKWYAEAGGIAPTTSHAAYPADAAYADNPGSNWRCKECHGWDYAGKDGAYASGKHSTGIPGIAGKRGAELAEIIGLLTSDSHGFGEHLGTDELRQLALFVRDGQFDMDRDINRATKVANGDAARGEVHYAVLCAGCHGADGKAEDMPVLGQVSNSNPWETLHKILNGQPDSAMPALRSLDRQVSVDILRYVQSLPTE